ncbi:MAG: macro domain-containing protein [Bacteroidetes bacterium]|nr:macro domain-containing protein [Bacteroidota bacterium]
MITYKQGNLLADEASALVNTVNMMGVMGKGIALQFKKEFPWNYRVYVDACQGGLVGIGKLLLMDDTSENYGEKLIINFATKIHWAKPSEYYFIEAGLKALVICIHDHTIKSIAIPALGCGNGGLDCNIVKPMIEKYLAPLDLIVNIYEPQLPAYENN